MLFLVIMIKILLVIILCFEWKCVIVRDFEIIFLVFEGRDNNGFLFFYFIWGLLIVLILVVGRTGFYLEIEWSVYGNNGENIEFMCVFWDVWRNG